MNNDYTSKRDEITTGEFPVCDCCGRQFIDSHDKRLCRKCKMFVAEEVQKARVEEVNNIVKDEYFHPSGRHMGAVKYHVQRYKELTPHTK